MIRIANIRIPVRQLDGSTHGERAVLRRVVARKLRVPERSIATVELLRRSVDARHRGDLRLNFTLLISLRGGSHAERNVYARLRRTHSDRDIQIVTDNTSDEVTDSALTPLTNGAEQRKVASDPATKRSRTAKSHQTAHQTHAVADRQLVVVGAGCAGLFCALALARAGLHPLLIERGDDVTRRTDAIASFNATGKLDLESNIQFGLGGAGTFSDGKLATGTKNTAHRAILDELVAAGAPRSIRFDAHPHIGSDLLPDVVAQLARKIEAAGGTVCTRTALVDLHVTHGHISAVTLATKDEAGTTHEQRLATSAVVLACGHSARDVFALLNARGITLERKAFALGVRIEHAQSAIDRAQYGNAAGHPSLGAAPYKLATHVGTSTERRGVFSFCMCPGGYVVAAASEPEGVVTNGMSLSLRDGTNANAGLLVDISTRDLARAATDGLCTGEGTLLDLYSIDSQSVCAVAADADTRLARGLRTREGIVIAGTNKADDALVGVRLQRALEHAAYAAGGGAFVAPVQLLGDFLAGVLSSDGGAVIPTYPRGIAWHHVDSCLPKYACEALRTAIPMLGHRLHGFDAPDAVLTGVETRSSSPVRIVRGDDGASISIKDLYPCGEGAGYAGGIMSAATDGLRVASWVTAKLLS